MKAIIRQLTLSRLTYIVFGLLAATALLGLLFTGRGMSGSVSEEIETQLTESSNLIRRFTIFRQAVEQPGIYGQQEGLLVSDIITYTDGLDDQQALIRGESGQSADVYDRFVSLWMNCREAALQFDALPLREQRPGVTVDSFVFNDTTRTVENILRSETLSLPGERAMQQAARLTAYADAIDRQHRLLRRHLFKHIHRAEKQQAGVYIAILVILLLLTVAAAAVYIIYVVKPTEKLARASSTEQLPAPTDTEAPIELIDLARIRLRYERRAESAGQFIRSLGSEDVSAEDLAVPDGLDEQLADLARGTLEHFREMRAQEQRQRSISDGLAKFAEILRASGSDTRRLADNLLIELVRYMGGSAGFFYLHNKTDRTLELLSCIAADRRKAIEEVFDDTSGLVGRCFQEGLPLYITEIPHDYKPLNLGLGVSKPGAVLLLPLVHKDTAHGVIELTTLSPFETHRLDFAYKLADEIAMTVAAVRTNEQTRRLLDESREMSDRLSMQEEELRQNVEELQAERESTDKLNNEYQAQLSAINRIMMIFELDTDGIITSANENFLKATGYTAEQINNLDYFELVPEAIRTNERYKAFRQRLLNNEPVRGEFQIIGAEGQTVWLEGSFSPIQEAAGQTKRILCYTYDITEDKERDEQLARRFKQLTAAEEILKKQVVKMREKDAAAKAAAAELRTAMDAVNRSAALLETDEQLTVQSMNEKFLELLGIAQSDAVGHHFFGLLREGPERPAVEKRIEEFRDSQKPMAEIIEFRDVKDDALWLQTTFNPVTDTNGNLTRVIVLAQDVTRMMMQQKQMEEAFERLRKSEEALKQTAEAMRRVNAELEEKNKEVERLRQAEVELNRKQQESQARMLGRVRDKYDVQIKELKAEIERLKTDSTNE